MLRIGTKGGASKGIKSRRFATEIKFIIKKEKGSRGKIEVDYLQERAPMLRIGNREGATSLFEVYSGLKMAYRGLKWSKIVKKKLPRLSEIVKNYQKTKRKLSKIVENCQKL